MGIKDAVAKAAHAAEDVAKGALDAAKEIVTDTVNQLEEAARGVHGRASPEKEPAAPAEEAAKKD
jgi:hypothetical protein